MKQMLIKTEKQSCSLVFHMSKSHYTEDLHPFYGAVVGAG